MNASYSRRMPVKAAHAVCMAGFTIVEIVISLVVLGILMAALVGMLNHFRTTSYQTAANNISLSVQQAINMKSASIFQILATHQATNCTRSSTMCEEAYDGAVILLTMPDGAEICGVEFASVNPPPLALGAQLSAGWVIAGQKLPFMGESMQLTGPDGYTYTSEIPLMESTHFCQ